MYASFKLVEKCLCIETRGRKNVCVYILEVEQLVCIDTRG